MAGRGIKKEEGRGERKRQRQEDREKESLVKRYHHHVDFYDIPLVLFTLAFPVLGVLELFSWDITL